MTPKPKWQVVVISVVSGLAAVWLLLNDAHRAAERAAQGSHGHSNPLLIQALGLVLGTGLVVWIVQRNRK
jgi:hypothetical protein